MTRRTAPLALLAGVLAVYWTVLGAPFVWDDVNLVRDNPTVRSWTGVPRAFVADIGAGSAVRYTFYRPLQTVSYVADHALWRSRPAGYRLTNVLLHALAAALLWALLDALFARPLLSFLAALAWALHPAHTQAVSYVAGRADPLAACFVLSSLLAWERRARGGSRAAFAASLAAFVAALLSKEVALVTPVLLLVAAATSGRRVPRALPAAMLALATAYAALRLTLLRDLLAFEPGQGGWADRLPAALASLARYAQLFLFPAHLHMEHGFPAAAWARPLTAAGALVASGLVALALRPGGEARPARFGAAWALAAFAPVSGVFLLNAGFAEHWLYLPSMGAAALIAWAVTAARARGPIVRAAAGALFAAWVAFLAVSTVLQNRVWADPERLYLHTLRAAPESFGANLNYGQYLTESGRFAEALDRFERAESLRPGHFFVPFLRAGAYHGMGRLEDAAAEYRRAIERAPGFAAAQNNLAVVLYLRGDLDGARAAASETRRLGAALHPQFETKLRDTK